MPKGQVGLDSQQPLPLQDKNQSPWGRASLAPGSSSLPEAVPGSSSQHSMASTLPVQTLRLFLILLAVLAPGAAGLYFWWEGGGFQSSRLRALSLPGLSTRALV